MTVSRTTKHTAAEPTFFQYTVGLMTVFCLMLLLKNGAVAAECVGRGLRLCAKTIVPSIFPFLVVAELTVSGGVAEMLPDRLTKPLQYLLCLPCAGCVAVMMGMLCGFPTGARCAVNALQRGLLSREECERALGCSCIPSAAFLIHAVGASLCQSRAFGILLYSSAALSALLCGVLMHPRKKEGYKRQIEPRLTPVPPLKGARLLTESIKHATTATLSICAYVVFFSAITGTVDAMLTCLSLPASLGAVLNVALELSSGVEHTATLASPVCAALLTAAAVGWSGLSVHCQLIALCDGSGLSYRPYFVTKLLQCVLCILLCGAALFLFPSLTPQ